MPANALRLNNVAMLASAALRPTLFVDANSGDDGNTGRSAAQALQTLAAAEAAAANGEIIGLARGSFWRESLDVSALSGITIMAYGTGDAPWITGMDYVPEASWTNVGGGTPNVYSTSISHDANGANRLRVYKIVTAFPPALPQLSQLTAVADLATCNSTPDSFVRVVGSDGSPVTVYMHPGSGFGTIQYQVTTRTLGIYAGDGTTIIGPIHTGECISNNGSLDLVGRSDSDVKQALAQFGSKHALGIGSGQMLDCIAYYLDAVTAAEPSNTAFVAYVEGGTGLTVLFARCGVQGPAPGVDFYAHGNPTGFDSVTLRQCWTVDTAAYVSSFDVIEGGYYSGVLQAPFDKGSISETVIRLGTDAVSASIGPYGDVTVEDTVVICTQRASAEAFRMNQTNAISFSHVALVCDISTGTALNWFANANSNQDMTMMHSIVYLGLNCMQLVTGGSYVGDFNVFAGYNGYAGGGTDAPYFQVPAGFISSLADWQSATGQDANSVWLKRADQVRGSADAFWLCVANDESDGPHVDGDFRINPTAKVYNAAGTALYGTFADGTTPITEAGPQNHWDWNARDTASGPPTAFPTPPADEAERLAYIADPASWDFYP